jgi:hypothetical protein
LELFDAERRRWRKECQQLKCLTEQRETKLAKREAQLTEQSAVLQGEEESLVQARAELKNARTQWESARDGQAAELDARRTEVDRLGSDLNSDRAEFEVARARWEASRDGEAAELEARRTELDQLATELDSAGAELAADREQLDRARTALDTQVDCQKEAAAEQAQEDLAARRTEVERRADTLSQQSADLEALRVDLESQREDLIREREELTALRQAMASERETVEADRQRFETLAATIEEQKAESDRQSSTLAREAADFQAERQAFAEEQSKWTAAQREAQKRVEQRAEHLDRRMEELDKRIEASESDKASWEALQAEAEARLTARAEQLDAREAELDQRPAEYETGDDQSEGLPFELSSVGGLEFLDEEEGSEPTELTNSQDLFRQMGVESSATPEAMSGMAESSDDWPTGEDTLLLSDLESTEQAIGRPEDDQVALTEPIPARSFAPASPDRGQPVPQSADGEADEDEEESIEHYMAGLLARASGERDANPAAAGPEGAGTAVLPQGRGEEPETGQSDPVDNVEGPLESIQSPAAVRQSPESGEDRPRARAPEKAEDLVSLRELANLSAHSALDTHARNRLLKSAHAKLAVVTIALATAGVLLWRWTVSPSSHMHFYAGLAVVLVAILWGVQYAAIVGYARLASGRCKKMGTAALAEATNAPVSDAGETVPEEQPVGTEVPLDEPSCDAFCESEPDGAG